MSFYLPLVLFCLSSSITPGPNNLMIMMTSLNYGVRKSLPHYFGICFGFSFMLIVVGLGLGEVFTTFPIIHTIIKFLGAAYLLYLSWKIAFAPTKIHLDNMKHPISFIQALLFQWINPKAWVMAISVFAIFSVNVPSSFVVQQVGIITLVFFLVLLPSIAAWMFGGVLLKFILKNERHLRIFNISMGLLLSLSIGLIFI